MLAFLVFVALATGAGDATPAAPGPATPRVLECTARNTPEGKDRRCRVKIPAGASIRRCNQADRAAGRCTLHREGALVAWAVGRNGAVCKLSKKKTDWTTRVAVKVGKATGPGAGSCQLFVGLE